MSYIVLNQSNPEAIVKPPYIYKVFKINDTEIISRGDTNYDIYYRYSQDYGRTVTNWEPFTVENITTTKITPIRFFQIEYWIKYNGTNNVNIYDINIIGDFQNVTLDYAKTNLYGVREDCNCIKLGLVNDPTSDMTQPQGEQSSLLMPNPPSGNLPILSDTQINALFKPYQISQAADLLNKMSNDANNIFGHEVVYFLTDPDKKGIDYTFHEYQLYNYVCDDFIKISVDNNQFPDNQITMNVFDLALFENFEVHIPKQIFKQVFGEDKRPSKEDFLWFCELNRMYTVEHAQPFRSFNNYVIYYKVYLKKYTQKANIIAGNQTIQDRVKQLTKNSTIDELFGRENTDDKKSIANKEEFRPLTHDTLRVEILADIEKELIENAENIISKSNYDLSSVPFGNDAVIYRNMKNDFLISDNISFFCWFNIFNYTTSDSYEFFNYYDDINSLGMKMTLQADNIKVYLNNLEYNLSIGIQGQAQGLDENTWYAYLVNINQRQRVISQYIYKRDTDDEDMASYLTSTILRKVYSSTNTMTPVEMVMENGTIARIKGSDMKLTNIRLFTEIIEEDQQSKLLNQSSIGNDSKYLIFADDANTRITLPYYPLGNIGNGGI